MDNLDNAENEDLLDLQDQLVFLVEWAQLDHEDLLVQLDHLGRLENLVKQDVVVFLDEMDQLDPEVQGDPWELLVLVDQQEVQDYVDLGVNLVQLVQLEKLVVLAHQV